MKDSNMITHNQFRDKRKVSIQIEISPELEKENVPDEEKHFSQRIRIPIVIAACIVAIVLGIIMPKHIGDKKEVPIASPQELAGYDYLLDLLTPISGEELLLDDSTPQYEALQWLAFEDSLSLPHDTSTRSIQLEQRYVAALLFFATGGMNWTDSLGFLSNTSVCEWQSAQAGYMESENGIGCNDQGFIIKIGADYNNLKGYIPFELGFMNSLEILSLRDDSLYGTIPAGLGHLYRLRVLNLSNNGGLTGHIPSTLGNLRNLEEIKLGGNMLSGTIPKEITKIRTLISIHLGRNNLVGTIPEFLPRLGIETINLRSNQLNGTIPLSMMGLLSLQSLVLSYNLLTGMIPNSIGRLSGLEVLQLHGNELDGRIPTTIGSLQDLYKIFLSENAFVGTIPTEFGQLFQLEKLGFDKNLLTGTIPSELGQLSQLKSLILEHNLLTGEVPTELGALEQLRDGYFGFFDNNIIGSVDSIFCNDTDTLQLPLFLHADCDEVECSCCTECCIDFMGECKPQLAEICDRYAYYYENDEYALEVAGTECNCLDGGAILACKDPLCTSCNSDGTVCVEMFDFGHEFTEDGSDNIWRCNMRYVEGRNETISWRVDNVANTCSLSIDGEQCKSCDLKHCSDGYTGYHVDCSNIHGEDSIWDECSQSRDGGGNSALHVFNHDFYEGDCVPCI